MGVGCAQGRWITRNSLQESVNQSVAVTGPSGRAGIRPS
jgi:hypothetical protein